MRYRKDKEENDRPTQVLKGGGFQPEKWENLKCGDIIKILEN